MGYERLAVVDASFLHIETAHEPQHVGALLYLEAGPLRDGRGRVRLDELRSSVSGRLHKVPRLRQKVMFVPFGQGRPIWVDDDSFDIDYHVRLTAVPWPGDDLQVQEVFGRIQSRPLDRDRPLWEVWFIDGLENDHLGLVIKCHHALGDGIATVDLLLTLADLDREPAEEPPGPAYRPRPAPSSNRLLVDSIVERGVRPVELLKAAAGLLRAPQKMARAVADSLVAMKDVLAPAPPAPWNAPVTKHRRWVSADVALDDVRAVRQRTDATVNDVVLALCTGALRDYLRLCGHDVEGSKIKAMVPVSRRHDDEHGAVLGNRVSFVMTDLPVAEPDPAARLRQIRERTVELKASGRAHGVETLLSAAGEFPVLAAPLARLVSHSVPMNLVITNIPGPRVPLFIRGSEVRRAYPYVEVIDNEGLTIAVVSYANRLFFGLTADRDVMPDLHLIAEGIEDGIGELLDATFGSTAR
jgi:diacylglycerol O-acyltransferase / wax synthase